MPKLPKVRLRSGGLSEIVPEPSPITYSFLSRWLTGSESVGRAMRLLKLPYQPFSETLVVRHNGKLYMDIIAEEKTLYSRTIFTYNGRRSKSAPDLVVSWRKLMNPAYWLQTLQLLNTQFSWTLYPYG